MINSYEAINYFRKQINLRSGSEIAARSDFKSGKNHVIWSETSSSISVLCFCSAKKPTIPKSITFLWKLTFWSENIQLPLINPQNCLFEWILISQFNHPIVTLLNKRVDTFPSLLKKIFLGLRVRQKFVCACFYWIITFFLWFCTKIFNLPHSNKIFYGNFLIKHLHFYHTHIIILTEIWVNPNFSHY